ncbi:MspA family porin [Nocardia nova]|uniref:MspA family porin n=1 Tax=Nocardia nova TaxID=37330 RepID=UPI0007A50950|nr:MspA family porin [Nocardia nova]
MRLPLLVAVGTVAVSVAVLALGPGRAELGRAQQPGAGISGGGVQLTASVDHIGVNPPGNRTPNYLMTFSHATQVSGDYSISVDGGSITSGQAVAGFLLGCGISVAGGVSVGISPNQGLNLSISPSANAPSMSGSAPSFSLGPSFAGSLGLSESLSGALSPGEVATVNTTTATLDNTTTFPYHITFNNAALNVSQCASAVSAVPFVTTSASTPQGLAQTTAYGAEFTF